MQKNLRVSVGRVLRDLSSLFEEEIDGVRPEDAANMVDLTIGYTPIVQHPWHRLMGIPKPDRVQTDGEKYAAVWPEHHDFQILRDVDHKIARARFLLLRGLFYREFECFPYPEQRKIVAWYFDGAMWRPKEGTPLYDAMFGKESPNADR